MSRCNCKHVYGEEHKELCFRSAERTNLLPLRRYKQTERFECIATYNSRYEATFRSVLIKADDPPWQCCCTQDAIWMSTIQAVRFHLNGPPCARIFQCLQICLYDFQFSMLALTCRRLEAHHLCWVCVSLPFESLCHSPIGGCWYVNIAKCLRCETALNDIRSIRECHMAADSHTITAGIFHISNHQCGGFVTGKLDRFSNPRTPWRASQRFVLSWTSSLTKRRF